MTDNRVLEFPHYIILKASAGSGKTTALTKRYVSFLLSPHIPHNGLRKILAITFSNNVAYEMKSRILRWLKDLYFKNAEVIKSFSEILSLNEDELSSSAGKVLDEIINNYSDFQVKTIDSFMTSIFKASAVDFDYNSDFEIIMNNEFFMNYAYDLFLKDLEEGTYKAEIFTEVIEKISPFRKSFIWDPAEDIFKKIKDLYQVRSSTVKEFYFTSVDSTRKDIENELIEIIKETMKEVSSSGFERNLKNQIFDSFDTIVKTRNFKEIIERGISTPPVKKPKDKVLLSKYEKIIFLWQKFQELVAKYAYLYATTFYSAYIEIFRDFEESLKKIKQKEGKIFIEDINKMLAEYLDTSLIPDVYFRLGERIHHFLIDEFQDTSPLQWANLKPLIENALSEGGSLFVVGDIKQAIYSFRGADYRIMRELEREHIFTSSVKKIEELNINYRSKGKILEFIDEFFKEKIKIKDLYLEASSLTDINSYEQTSQKGTENEGYVEIKAFYTEDDEREIAVREYLLKTIKGVQERGYALKDIAILAFKNEQVVAVSSLLNELKLPFISYSSLDVRKRKVTIEILNLLKFLDSPIDDFSFSVFILGDLYKRFMAQIENTEEEIIFREIEQFILKNRDFSPLYKCFQNHFPQIWQSYFQNLFRLTGYLPLYDLLIAIFNSFKVFEIMPEEEATFLKILEVVKIFEGKRLGSIKDFIEFVSSTSDDERIWNIPLGSNIDAIQVMTIHKAKGLGFPVVILFLEDLRDKVNEYVVHETEKGINLLKITNELADKSDILKAIKNNEKLFRMTEILNTLYVAFTRAQEELYVLCKIKKKKSFPFDVLGEFFDKNYGSKTYRIPSKFSEFSTISVEHYYSGVDFPVISEKIHFKEKQRGEFIHNVLSEIEYFYEGLFDELELKIEKLTRKMKKHFDIREIKKIIMNMFNNKEMIELFIPKSGRRVFNEFEVSDEKGLIHRIDRIVIDSDKVTLIEYKTGNPSEEHIKQLKLYLKLISSIYKNFDVRGCLYYLDLGKIRWM